MQQRRRHRYRRTWRFLQVAGVVTAAVFVAMQLVPYGWQHPNPPVTEEAPWPNQVAEGVARSACYSCHSNETGWPWYSYVAPMSWLVRRDVEAGRDELNFSEWDRDDNDAGDAAETVEEGSMPPSRFTIAHPGARLSDQEKQLLIAALKEMDGASDDDSGGRNRGRGGDDESG